MEVWLWLLQILILLVAWKLVHLFFWNMRKMLANKSLLLSMLITLLIAILAVSLAHTWHSAWSQTLIVAALLGIANAEYEYNRTQT